MRVERNETIAGHPAVQVRALFREACRRTDGVTLSLARRALSLPDDPSAQQVIERLRAAGFIEDHDPHDRLVGFRVTRKGATLAAAPAHRPLLRETAERHLAALLGRVTTLAHRDFLYLAAEVLVFGSYLGDAPRVGDLDVAIRLVPKIEDPKVFRARCEERSRSARRSFNTFLEYLWWPQQEVRRFLTSRAHGLAVVWEIDDFVWGVPFKVAYVDPHWAAQWPGTHVGYRVGPPSGSVVHLYHERHDAAALAGSRKPRRIRIALERPLILDTPERLRDALEVKSTASTAGVGIDPLGGWPRAAGYDSVVIPASALKGQSPFRHPITLLFVPCPAAPQLYSVGVWTTAESSRERRARSRGDGR
jgi:hypothetical protein